MINDIVTFNNTIANYNFPGDELPQVDDVIFTITGPDFDNPTGYIYFKITSLSLGTWNEGPDNFVTIQLSDGDIEDRSISEDFPYGYIWGDFEDIGEYGGSIYSWDAVLYEDPTIEEEEPVVINNLNLISYKRLIVIGNNSLWYEVI
jgi:hypothetical protein